MTSRTLAVAALLVAGAVHPAFGQPLPPAGTAVVDKWLECEDCIDGELQALVKLGTPAVPSLGAALRSGPPQNKRTAYQTQLSATYQQAVAYAKTHPEAPVPTTEADYIRRHMDNQVTRYQIRAANGLGAIGGPDAKKELTQALGLPLPTAVLVSVREALLRIP